MTTFAIPARERVSGARSRVWRGATSAVASTARALVRPHRAALASLTRMPLTVAGFSCLGGAAWWWHPIVGLFSAGVLLIVLELMIADEP